MNNAEPEAAPRYHLTLEKGLVGRKSSEHSYLF